MKIPKLKKWQWVVLVLLALMLLGAVVPEQKPVEGAETTSPAVLLWIPVVILPVYLLIRSRKKKKAGFEAAKPSAEKFLEEIRGINEKIEFFTNHESQYNEAEPGGVIAKRVNT